jgi:uncharacterized membrane protein
MPTSPPLTFQALLLLTVLLCSLVAGFLFAFAVVVMPGLGRLDDREFIQAFQAIDGVIQRNQPLFMLVWVGSVLSAIATATCGLWTLGAVDRVVAIVAVLEYLFGVQLPTIAVNIPLNNQLQKVDSGALDDSARRQVRTRFEVRWNRWNRVRTAFACITSLLLLFLLATAGR